MRLRLRRPMRGRAVPFRQGLIESGGCAPSRGHSPGMNECPVRWGRATTAHQAAQPRPGVFVQHLPHPGSIIVDPQGTYWPTGSRISSFFDRYTRKQIGIVSENRINTEVVQLEVSFLRASASPASVNQ